MRPHMPAGTALLFAVALSAAQFLPAGQAHAAEEEETARISVSAEGTASTVPDMAVINLTVLREAETARAALDANSEAMAAVLAAMKAEGIADRDLQTTDFSIQPRWVYPDSGSNGRQEPRIVGYQVVNGLTVRIRDLDRLGAILDKSVSLGVNQGGNIAFTNDKPEETIAAARKDAVAKAMEKARQLTEAAGVGLGRVVQISEQSYAMPPIPLARAEFAKAASDAAVPVAAGENEYRVSVSMTWEIAQ